MMQFGILKKNDLEPISFYASDGKMTQKYVLTPTSTKADESTYLVPFQLLSETGDICVEATHGVYERIYYAGFEKMLMTMSLKIVDNDEQLISITYATTR